MSVYDICEMILEYFAECKWLILFVVSMIDFTYLYFRKNSLFIIVSMILIIAVFNNLSISIVEKFSSSTFYRNIWLIPVPHLIAASVILMLWKIRYDKLRYGIITILLILLITNSSFETVFPNGLPQNIYLLNDDIPILYDAIKNDLKIPNSRPKVIMPKDLWLMFNEYDAEVRNIVGIDELFNSIQSGEGDLMDLKRLISDYDPQYIIISVADIDMGDLDYLGFKEITKTTSFALYKVYINGINKEIVFDDRINETREYYYNTNDNLVLNDQGYAVAISEYNNKNQLIKKIFYGVDGKRSLNELGISAVEYERDGNGDVIDEEYFGMDDKRILASSNVSEIKYERNNYGQLKYMMCYGLKGERVLNSNGISMYEFDYDDFGNPKMECYYGINNEKIDHGGYWKVMRVFNENHKVIHEEYYDVEGKPVLAWGAYATIDFVYDESGKMSKMIYRDIAGKVIEEKAIV